MKPSTRTAVWTVLVLSAAANAATSMSGLSTLLAVGFGVVTLGCVAALVADYLKRRRA